jgi:uncharacterized membrane protein YphA (DoxX/SURF4 family)
MAGMAGKVILLVLQLLLGAFFAYSGVVKIYDFPGHTWATQDFYEAIINYHLTSSNFAMLAAVYLPWLELLAGVALLVRRGTLGALTIIGVLLAIFIAALASAWYRGIDVSCGCFGREVVATNYPLHIGGNTLLLALTVFLLWREGFYGLSSRVDSKPSGSASAVA